MIGKIVKGTSFSGCVNYVLKEDKSRLLKAVGVYGSPEEIAEQFELQTLLNDKVKNKVGHISLSFSAEDGDRIRDDDGLMLKIAHDYMKLMEIENTQFIIARHTDRDHPHCHIVYNRVDNDGRTISDKNDRYRNEKVCKMLTARYRLHFAEGKENVNFMRLRHHDKVSTAGTGVLRRLPQVVRRLQGSGLHAPHAGRGRFDAGCHRHRHCRPERRGGRRKLWHRLVLHRRYHGKLASISLRSRPSPMRI